MCNACNDLQGYLDEANDTDLQFDTTLRKMNMQDNM